MTNRPPRVRPECEVVRSIESSPGRRLVLLSLGAEGMLRVIALRGGQILATA